MIEAARALAQRSYLAGGDTSTILRRMYITALRPGKSEWKQAFDVESDVTDADGTRRISLTRPSSDSASARNNARELRKFNLDFEHIFGDGTLVVRADDSVETGCVFIPFHFREAAANLLTLEKVDPDGKIPGFKFCAVNIEKA